MKKKLIALVLMLAIVLTIGLVACNKTEEPATKTAVVGIVGQEKHTYFPYSVVTLDKNNAPLSVEIGECFGPTGKLWVDKKDSGEALAYNNPWYPGLSTTVTAFVAAADDTARNAAVADKFISINGEVWTMSWHEVSITARAASYLPDATNDVQRTYKAIQFKKGDTWLSDEYLADNMAWYLAAINSNKMFPCNATGTKTEIGGKIFQDGAPRKNDVKCVYNASRGLNGPQFCTAMRALETFAIEKNFNITYTAATSDRPGRIQGFDYAGLIAQFPTSINASASASNEAQYLWYAKAYISTAVLAYEAAKAL